MNSKNSPTVVAQESYDAIEKYFFNVGVRNKEQLHTIVLKKKHQIIDIVEGDLCFVEKGVIDLWMKSPSDENQKGIFSSYYKGDIFINDNKHKHIYKSGLRGVTLKKINQSLFNEKRNSAIEDQMMHTTLRLYNDLSSNECNIRGLNSGDRVRNAIGFLVGNQGKKMLNGEYVLYANPTHKYLGALSFASRQTVATKLSELNAGGVIKYKGRDAHLLVCDMSKLLGK